MSNDQNVKRTDAAVQAAESRGWTYSESALTRTYKFKSFAHAFGFMVACVPTVAAKDHHPEWINSFDRVDVRLSTHTTKGVTAKDIELAEIMDTIAANFLKENA